MTLAFKLLLATIICWGIGKFIQKTSVDGKGTPDAIIPMLFFYAAAVILMICTLVAI